MSKQIAIIGECMIEFSVTGKTCQTGFGGDTLNTAIYLARLSGSQTQIHYVTALGIDPFSQQMLTSWQQEQIDTDLVQQLTDKMPGLYTIVTDGQGERAFYYWRSNSAAKFWLQTPDTPAICQHIAETDYVYLSGISLAILDPSSLAALMALLAEVKRRGGQLIFDNNYRPALWADKPSAKQAYAQILALTDIAFLTLDDEMALWDDLSYESALERTQHFGVPEIVIKRGADCCLIQSGDDFFAVPALRVPAERIIDTTAAGDSFSAGYLAARLAGQTPVKAAELGHLLASTVIQFRGAIIPLHNMPIIEYQLDEC
ncbi:sugar kinase [Utexia brackfieldae]|uniref:sugar kinase n=1 Tax=Utexia brackfieldae TaxID=3074108 RepID=UPI00370D8E9B